MKAEVSGLLLLDKPGGLTSHDVVNRIRRISGIRRVGHAGTLDPLATGLLVTAVGRATRLLEYLVGHDKTYLATVRLGQETNTYDAEGDIIRERPYAHLTPAEIDGALNAFRGNSQQRPPLYSAIKQGGQPAYKLARQGKTAVLPLRSITIHTLELLDWSPPDVQLRVTCSSGTYIRSLAHDLGQGLGCGGHISALRRTAVADFTVERAVCLDALSPATWIDVLLPMETAVAHLPQLDVTETAAADLRHGRAIPNQPNQPEAALVRAVAPDGLFIGIAARQDGGWRPKKIMAAPESH